MKKAYHVKYTKDAWERLPLSSRERMIQDAVKMADRLPLMKGDAPILNVDPYRLKILIRPEQLEIWVMTFEEAERGGLPDKPLMHNQN